MTAKIKSRKLMFGFLNSRKHIVSEKPESIYYTIHIFCSSFWKPFVIFHFLQWLWENSWLFRALLKRWFILRSFEYIFETNSCENCEESIAEFKFPKTEQSYTASQDSFSHCTKILVTSIENIIFWAAFLHQLWISFLQVKISCHNW